jgi:MSHA biogenesis protein MshK
VFNRPLKNYCARLCGVEINLKMLMYNLYTALLTRSARPAGQPAAVTRYSTLRLISPCLAVARYIFQQPVKLACLGLLLGLCSVAHAALDPTQPSASALTASASDSASTALRLQSIVRGAGQSQAVINGQSLRVGDEVAGAKLRAIYTRSVVLERQGQQQVLRLVEPIMKPSR